ncbi:LOG family protein [Candidatus Minimicrobia naudis]|uniref:LOG family protein n=1 Tax=Candidatus Minimicrobia naudis TaxID=2841263 RepID=A0A8F1MAT3_9BACT|nr:LOG family protein [Candidatus Minimicrobia naudis]
MDEICEIITLTQTKKMAPVPIVLFDKKFWGKWDDFVCKNMLPNKLISDGDEKTYTITEDITEVVELNQESANLLRPIIYFLGFGSIQQIPP